ncbi:MAG TPA: hypothetical protein VHP37_03270 [Burkholderiales bacterium]|nr:hypothetical protein [Burkholderiales bacterium]
MSDAKQQQNSQQSTTNLSGKPEGSKPRDQDTPTGIGSSQGQDTENRPSRRGGVPRTGEGTADIERGSAGPHESDSLADDPVGAFKERP